MSLSFSKKIKFIFLSFFFTFYISASENEALKEIEQKNVLRVGVNYPSFPPYDIIEDYYDNIIYKGLSSDILSLISKKLDVKLEFMFYESRNDSIVALLNDEIDIIPSANGYERQYGLLLSSIYFPDRPILFRSSRSAEINKVSIAYEYLSDNILESVFPNYEFLYYPSREDAISAAVFGETDAVINDLLSLNYSFNNHYISELKYVNIIDVDSYGFAFAVNDLLLQEKINSALSSIDDEVYQLIMHKWSGGGIVPPIYSELEEIKEHALALNLDNEVIKVIISPYQAPFSYIDKHGNSQGIIDEILNVFNMYTGVKFDIIVKDDYNEALSYLNNGYADLILMIDSKSRRNSFIVSDMLYSNPFVYVINKGTNIKNIQYLYTTNNSVINEFYDTSKYTHIEFDNYISVLEKVTENKNSMAIMPISVASYYISQYFINDLEIENASYSLPHAKVVFAATKDNQDLIDFINILMRKIPRSQFEIIANMWRKNALIFNNTWKDYKYTVYTLSLSIFIIVFLVIIYWLFAKKSIKVERELKEKNSEQLKFLQEIIDAIPHPIYFIDNKFTIQVSNLAFKNLFFNVNNNKYLLKESLGLEQFFNFVSLHKKVLTYKKNHSSDQEVTIKNKKYIIFHWQYPYNDMYGNISGVIGGAIDVSERIALLDELESAKRSAEDASYAKSLFLATMSHEIRTPMNVIIGALDLVINHNFHSEEKQKYLKIAYTSAKDLLALIGDILDISKIEANELAIEPSLSSFRETVNSIYNMFFGLAKQKNIKFDLLYDQSINDYLYFDHVRVRQILLNIISNAIKFTDIGFVKLSVLNNGYIDGYQKIRVILEDTGIGIDHEEIDKLFKTFSQTSSSYNRGGTGLGLMITKNLCDLMSAQLDLISRLNMGTTITISFKFKIGDSINDNFVKDDYSLDKTPAQKILLVDDHPSNRIILSKQIEQLGHTVYTSVNGIDAIRKLEDFPDIDIVITDCHMPEMDGYELSRFIRNKVDPLRTNPMIIFAFTANAQTEIRIKCIDSGMNECLFKPLDINELNLKIKNSYFSLKVGFDESFINPVLGYEPIPVFTKLIELKSLGIDIIEIMGMFIDDTKKDIQCISQTTSLIEKLELIHRIKSASNMLGFKDLTDLCVEIEEKQSIDGQDIISIDNIVDEISSLWELESKNYL